MMNNNNFYVINDLNTSLLLQYQYKECYNCVMRNRSLSSSSIVNLSMIPNMLLQVVIYSGIGGNESLCSDKWQLAEDVKYNYSIVSRDGSGIRNNRNDMVKCILMPLDQTKDFMLPFYIALIVLCLTAVLFYTALMIYRHRILHKLLSRVFLYQVDSYMDLGNPSLASPPPYASEGDEENQRFVYSFLEQRARASAVKRVKGIDTLRGLSIVLMIFVNYGGGNYYFMEHSHWNGLTVADLVFPWFVFVMGVTVALSFCRATMKRMSIRFLIYFWLRSAKRSVLLFMIGIALENPGNQLWQLRIMGPLQRLAISYLCLTSAICLVSMCKGACQSLLPNDIESDMMTSPPNEINVIERSSVLCKCREAFLDVWKCFPYICLAVGLLVCHATLSLLLKVPNCPRGYLGPGGIGDHGCCGNCSGGVAGYIDRLILTPNHMYNKSTNRKFYESSQRFDPEGLLGNLTSAALCLIGFWAGNVLLLNRNWTAIIKRLFIYAIICAAIGAGLCQCRIDGGLIPINKNLWSVSYVLVTSGMSLFLLGVIFVMVDVLHIWSGSPFKYPGMNSIAIYIGHILMEKTFPIQWQLGLSSPDHVYKLIMNIWGVTFWTVVSYVMYLKQVFISV